MFFTRHDGAFRKGLARRIKSPRASVYLEFAIVMPLVAIVISFLFEFISLWDARCMANHAAWVCGRIASVNVGSAAYQTKTQKNDLLTKDMKTATMYLMSTCSMGGMGVRVGQGSPSFDKSKITDVVETPYAAIQDCFTVNWEGLIKEVINSKFPDFSGLSLVAALRKIIVDGLTNLILKITAPLTDLLDQVTKDVIFHGATGTGSLTNALTTVDRLWQFETAQKRMSLYGNRIFDIVQREDSASQLYFTANGTSLENGIDFPRQVSRTNQSNKWMVDYDQGWPPNQQNQRMIDVKIYWPFERAWLWQALAFLNQTVSDSDCVAAHGRALVYPQPIIKNSNLDSENPEAFAEGEDSALDVIADLQAEYNNFLKTVWFWYKYRMHEEHVYDYDTDVGSDGDVQNGGTSYHFLSGKRLTEDDGGFDGAQNAAWSNWDGLYNWMTSVLGDDIEAELQSYGNQTKKARELLRGENNNKSLSLEICKRFGLLGGSTKYQSKSYLESFKRFCKNERNPLKTYNFQNGQDTVKGYFTKEGYRYGFAYRSRNWFYWNIDPTICTTNDLRQRYDHFKAADLNNYFLHANESVNYYNFKVWNKEGDGKENSASTAKGTVFMIAFEQGRKRWDLSQYDCLWPDWKGQPEVPNCIKAEIRNVAKNGNTGFNNEDALYAFANDVYSYWLTEAGGSLTQSPYLRPGARWLIMNTAKSDTEAENYMNRELVAYRKLLTADWYTNCVKVAETNSLAMIKQCRKELGQNLGMESGSSSDIIDMDQMATGNPLPQDIQDQITKMDDPEKIKELVKPYFDAQKKLVFAALQAVDAAEKALIDFNAEGKFKGIRDDRMSTIYTWIAQELVILYCGKYGWNYKEYQIQRMSVARDNRFLDQTERFENLAEDWRGLLNALTAADEALGKELGLTCVTKNTTTLYNGQTIDAEEISLPPDPNTPDTASTESGSNDDKRGSEWKFNSETKRWHKSEDGW